MKKLLSMFICGLTILVTSQTVAHENGMKVGKKFGGYGGPVFRVSQVNNGTAIFLGGRGGCIMTNRFSISGAGYGMVNTIKLTDEKNLQHMNSHSARLRMGYGGVDLSYAFASNRRIHGTISTLIGGGIASKSYSLTDSQEEVSKTTGIFVLEPMIDIEINAASFIRPCIGIGYRQVLGSQLAGVTNNDLSGFVGRVSVKFGKF